MNNAKALYIFTTAPYSNAVGQEGLDAVLTGAAFDLDISVLFLHNGVFQIKKGQDNSASELKQVTKTFAALNDFGVDKLYAYDISLAAAGLSEQQLFVDVEVVKHGFIRGLIKQSTRVFTF